MSDGGCGRLRRRSGLASALGAALLAGACAQLGDAGLTTGSSLAPAQEGQHASQNRSELEKATEYWGREYAKNPRNLKAALSYARNLKASGQKTQAFAVLQQVAVFNGEDRELASEYGRLALDLGQVQVAQKVLAAADDPAKPDWRIISARGTVLAKQDKYSEAIPFYERALTLAPDQASVMSNLGLAYAAEGQPDKAEPLLRRATELDRSEPRLRQNLALVLGLRGKYDEAKETAGRDLAPEVAAANVDWIRKIVRLEPVKTAAPVMQASVSGWGITTSSVGAWTTGVTRHR